MEKTVIDGVNSVFSLMPEEEAKESLRDLIENYWKNKSAYASLDIKWIEFDESTNSILSGYFEFEHLTTHIYMEEAKNYDIDFLIKLAKEGSYKVGEIIKGENGDKLYWFLSNPSVSESHKIKGICIDEAVFCNLLEVFNSNSSLTKSEKRVVFQIICGDNLNQSSSVDGVSVETKRSQFKVATKKLDCSGQTDVIRLILGQLMHLVAISSSSYFDRKSNRLPEHYAKKYFSHDISLSYKHLSNGNTIRVFECGPIDGRPLVLIHGMLYPILLATCKKYLMDNSIRLIMPLRYGFLENYSIFELYERDHLLRNSIRDITLFIKESFSKPVAIMGQSLGSPIAIRLAIESPHLFSQLICATVNQGKAHEKSSSFNKKFYTGLNKVIKVPGVLRLITWQFKVHYTKIENAKPFLKKIFGETNKGSELLDLKIGGQPAYHWFVDSYKHSVVGISEDFSFAMSECNYELSEVKIPIIFIQGEDDLLYPVEALKEFSDGNESSEIFYINEGGHFVYGSHPELFWGKVRQLLAEHEQL